MKSLSIVSLALVVLLGSAVGLCAAESETFTGTAAASGTYKRPQLLVDGKRYELKASDKADAAVAATLARFSKGDTGTYVVKGRRGTVNGVDGILIDSITPAEADPGTGAPAAAKRPGYQVYDHVVKATPPARGEQRPTMALQWRGVGRTKAEGLRPASFTQAQGRTRHAAPPAHPRDAPGDP